MSGKGGTRPRRVQFGLGRIRAAIALIAVVLAIGRFVTAPGSGRLFLRVAGALVGAGLVLLGSVALIAILLVAALCLVTLIDEMVLGVRCPSCAGRRMQRRSIRPFRHRFFLCPDCGARRKRRGPGRPWSDASLLEDDRWFQPRRPAHPWKNDPDAVPADLSGSTGALLRNKRQRSES